MATVDSDQLRADGSATEAALGSGQGGTNRGSLVNGRVHVAQMVTTLGRGGAQLTVLESTVADPARFEMTILAGSDRPPDGDFWEDPRLSGVNVVEIPALRRNIAIGDDTRTLVWLIRWLRTVRPDVLHTHSTKAGVLGRLAGLVTRVPVIHTVHGWAGPLYSERPLVRWAVAMLERGLAKLSQALVVVGHGDREIGLRHRIGHHGQYHVIRSGIRLPEAVPDRDRLRSTLGFEDNDLVIGMVARFAEQKDHSSALRAFAPLAYAFGNATMVFVGDGPTRPEAQAMATELGIENRVVFAGHRDDAAEIAAAFDICVLATNWEGVPRSLVEAAASGVPMIVSDVGSVADIVVDGKSGFLVPIGDVRALTARLEQLLAAPELRRTLGAAAVRQAAGFSVEQMRSDLHTLWRSVAANQRRRVSTHRS